MLSKRAPTNCSFAVCRVKASMWSGLFIIGRHAEYCGPLHFMLMALVRRVLFKVCLGDTYYMLVYDFLDQPHVRRQGLNIRTHPVLLIAASRFTPSSCAAFRLHITAHYRLKDPLPQLQVLFCFLLLLRECQQRYFVPLFKYIILNILCTEIR